MYVIRVVRVYILESIQSEAPSIDSSFDFDLYIKIRADQVFAPGLDPEVFDMVVWA